MAMKDQYLHPIQHHIASRNLSVTVCLVLFQNSFDIRNASSVLLTKWLVTTVKCICHFKNVPLQNFPSIKMAIDLADTDTSV